VAKVGTVVIVPLVGRGFWNVGTFPSEVIDRYHAPALQLAIAFVLIALFFFSQPVSAQTPVAPNDIADVSLRTGAQLSQRLDQLLKTRNVSAAVRYFEERKMRPVISGLAEVRGSRVSTKQSLTLSIIPFTEQSGSDVDKGGGITSTLPLQSIVLSAEGAKGSTVLLGTILVQDKAPPEVKEESRVEDGKIVPGQGLLRAWLECSSYGCVPAALGCLTGGPGWAGCFCFWCGGSALACGFWKLYDASR
jgi:hypothetical protein